MFTSLMPERKEFFDLLAAHSDRVVAGANATLRLINALGEGDKNLDALVSEVNMNEKSGDKIKEDLISLLHRSFTTPINRDQIHSLTIELDEILNSLQDVANAIGMYSIKDSTVETREMASLAADACMMLNRTVIALAESRGNEEAMNLCKEVDSIETSADEVLRKAITKLFQDESDITLTIKMREFYFLQEKVIDCCQDASKTIEEIILENS